MRKVCVITGYRSDYTKLKSVLSCIKANNELCLQLVAFGAHMLDSYGKTVNQIEQDGFSIDMKLTTNVDGSTPHCMAKSIGLAMIELAGALEQLAPDIVLIVGDRYEIMAAALSASISNIPVAHIQGGELSGTIDEVIRHCITKMSHIHFPSTELSAQRVQSLGENPENIFNVGCPAVDFIKGVDFVERDQLNTLPGLKTLKVDFENPYHILAYHPVTTEYGNAGTDMTEALEALQQTGTQTILIYPNPDAGSDGILRAIRSFTRRHKKKSVLINKYKNLPFESYLNLLKHSSCLVGNSSSGIREAHIFNTPVVNIGTRQQGRERTENILDAMCDQTAIVSAIKAATTSTYDIRNNLYGHGQAGQNIATILSNHNIEDIINKRLFITP